MSTSKSVTNPTPDIITGYAPVNGIQMYYEVHGEGVPLVLVHGGGSTIETSFGRLLPLLKQKFKVIALELQAHGRTSDRDAPESFEQDADDVAALLNFLAVDQAHLLGFSNGGNTVLQVANRHPQLAEKLVVVSAFYQREGMIPAFFDGMKAVGLEHMPALLKEYFLKVNNNPDALQTMFNKDKQRMLDFKDWKEEVLTSIAQPTLLIFGDKDVMTKEHAVKMSELIPNAQLTILPGVHGACIGEVCAVNEGSKLPELTAFLIEEFLNGKDSSK